MAPTAPLFWACAPPAGGAADALLGVVVAAATAGALLRYGLGHLWRNWAFARRAARAPGRIVAWCDDVLVRYPLLRYETPEGRSVLAHSRCGSVLCPRRAGEAVTVLYDPAAPDDACPASRWLLWGQPLLAALLGGLCLVLLAACALAPVPTA